MRLRIALFAAGLALALGLALLLPRLGAPPDRAALAMRLLDDGRAEDAAYLFEEPAWRGVAEFRAGRHVRAIAEFLAGETPETIYNSGVAYARIHEWGAAKAAFSKTLRLAPGHEDARHNLAVVAEAEAAERRMIEDALGEGDRGGWAGGELSTQTGVGDGGERREDGDVAGGETSAARTMGTEGGDSASAGLLGEGRMAADPGVAPSGGEAGAEEPALDGVSGAAGRQLRESAQAAEILLRRIRDDPERVLRARLLAAHERRMKRETASCSGC